MGSMNCIYSPPVTRRDLRRYRPTKVAARR